MKYRSEFPARFGSRQDAAAFCQRFFPWYNRKHRHESLGYMTPHDVHHGVAAAKRERRAEVLRRAHLAHPERFPHGQPEPPRLPTEVWINKPEADEHSEDAH